MKKNKGTHGAPTVFKTHKKIQKNNDLELAAMYRNFTLYSAENSFNYMYGQLGYNSLKKIRNLTFVLFKFSRLPELWLNNVDT